LLPSERELITALDERIRRSPLRDLAQPPRWAPPRTKESVLEGVVGVVEKIIDPSISTVRYQVGRPGLIEVSSRPTGKRIALHSRRRKYDPELKGIHFEPVVVPRKQVLGTPTPVAKLGEPNQRVTWRG
jgi:hypothetical protein